MKYFVNRDEDTGEIGLLARFSSDGLPEVWRDGVWIEQTSTLISMMNEGLLDEISAVEAQNYLAKKAVKELQLV